ncbi:MAG TPA: PorP/SprF family type IX secretion system membrane protein [Saprospiraceae bacterium]|nr:PorP/SprF family type IX secretion system membrane protein [Saprospiraceae bacterium]
MRTLRLFFLVGYILVSIGFSSEQLGAQDMRFSQFHTNSLHLNPAMTGLYNGGTRFAVSYRTLFYSVLQDKEYESYSGSFENRWKVGNSFFGGGGIVLRDQIGTSGYERTYVMASGAYQQNLSTGGPRQPDMFLALGFQAGFGQYAMDPSSLWFSNQFDNDLLEVDFSRDAGEPFSSVTNQSFSDFNVGLLFFYSFPEDDGDSFYLGGAMHHVTQPKVGLLEESPESLYRRYTVHIGGAFNQGDWSFLPSAMYRQQGPTMSTLAGFAFRLGLGEEKDIKLRAGSWVHLAKRFDNTVQMEGVIVGTTFEVKGWHLGLSYDITTSTLNRSNFSRGAFELSLVRVSPAQYRSRLKCPEF